MRNKWISVFEIIKFAEENLSPEDLKTFEETLDKIDKPQLAIVTYSNTSKEYQILERN